MNKQVITAVMLGGNIGNSELLFASARLNLERGGLKILSASQILRSAAEECVPGTPDFSDQALLGQWNGNADQLLELLQTTERQHGRPALHSSRESRTLDCDLILFGGEIINSPRLQVPHPRARNRRFVLETLVQIAPELIFPDTGESVAGAFAKLGNPVQIGGN